MGMLLQRFINLHIVPCMSVQPPIIVDFKEYILDEPLFPGRSSIMINDPTRNYYKREFVAVLDDNKLHDKYGCSIKELKKMIHNEKYIEKIELTLTLDEARYVQKFPNGGERSNAIPLDKKRISIEDDKFLICDVSLDPYDPESQTYCFLKDDLFTIEIKLKKNRE